MDEDNQTLIIIVFIIIIVILKLKPCPAVGHGVFGIGDHVQKGLPELVFGSLYFADTVGEGRVYFDVVFLKLLPVEQQDLIDDRVVIIPG